MPYAIETFQLIKEFPQNKRFRDLLFSPFSKEKNTALFNVSLKAKKGEIFCLLGPNGAGKTTLIKVLCTLALPTHGRALVNGHDVVKNPKEVRRAIGYVISDERSFYWRLNAYQNLKFFGLLNNMRASELKQKIKKTLGLVGLEKMAGVMFKDFSQGMKQKLAIARAFLAEPQILFMDEPTRALDPTSANLLRRFIYDEIVGRQGKTVFLATHNLKEVEEIGHRMAFIHEGKIKACGTLGELSHIIEEPDRYVVCLKADVAGPLFFLEKVQQHFKEDAEIKALGQKAEGHEMEITINKKKELGISEIIACIINNGGKIESCFKKEIPLYEIYSKYTGEYISD